MDAVIRLTADRAAAVNTRLPWLPVAQIEPPRGVRLLLIDRRRGVAVIGEWSPKSEWTHWQGLPKFQD